MPPKKNNGKFQSDINPNLKPLKNSGQKDGQGGSPILNLKANNQKIVELTFR
jgi:hypothetical protein